MNFLAQSWSFLTRRLAGALGLERKPRLVSLEMLAAFTEAQAAYVSQTTLYGYVRTRAGTQWPKLFSDKTYQVSLRIARWHFYAACAGDLALYLAARLRVDASLSNEEASQIADGIVRAVLETPPRDDIPPKAFAEVISRTTQRASMLDWNRAATSADVFSSSAEAFLRWAPMADEFKEQDEEIMRNSLYLRWVGIRREVRERLDSAAVRERLDSAAVRECFDPD